jgi:hypothetical protein
MNDLRRQRMIKDTQRNLIPAQRDPETEALKQTEQPPQNMLGRLAIRLNLSGSAGEAS